MDHIDSGGFGRQGIAPFGARRYVTAQAPTNIASRPSTSEVLPMPEATLPPMKSLDHTNLPSRRTGRSWSVHPRRRAPRPTPRTSTCPPAKAFYCGESNCGGTSGCPPIPSICPSGMSCTSTGTSCACTGESIPCGDARLSGLTCNFCKWGTCPPGMTCGGVPKQGECGFDCACH